MGWCLSFVLESRPLNQASKEDRAEAMQMISKSMQKGDDQFAQTNMELWELEDEAEKIAEDAIVEVAARGECERILFIANRWFKRANTAYQDGFYRACTRERKGEGRIFLPDPPCSNCE